MKSREEPIRSTKLEINSSSNSLATTAIATTLIYSIWDKIIRTCTRSSSKRGLLHWQCDLIVIIAHVLLSSLSLLLRCYCCCSSVDEVAVDSLLKVSISWCTTINTFEGSTILSRGSKGQEWVTSVTQQVHYVRWEVWCTNYCFRIKRVTS